MNKNILPLISGAIALAVGVYIGMQWPAKETPAPELVDENREPAAPAGARLVNPMLDCIENNRLDMRELAVFKPEITRYIDRCKKKFPDIHISYYFRDLNNGLWTGINEKELFSPASLMKVPIMIAVLKEAQANPAILGEQIKFEAKRFDGIDEESGFEKKDGSVYSVEEYMKQMIAYSDNAAAVILLDKVGIDKVNQVQRDLNLYEENITDPQANFIPVNRYSGVFRILYNASYLNKDMSEKALQMLSQSVYKRGIREAVPAQYPIAHKYGERDLFDAKGNRHTLQLHHFAIVFYTGKPYLLGIMTRGANREAKETVIRDLAKITFDEVDAQMKKPRAKYEE